MKVTAPPADLNSSGLPSALKKSTKRVGFQDTQQTTPIMGGGGSAAVNSVAKVTSFQAEEDSIKKVSKFAEDHHLQLKTDHSDANQQDCSPLEFVPP